MLNLLLILDAEIWWGKNEPRKYSRQVSTIPQEKIICAIPQVSFSNMENMDNMGGELTGITDKKLGNEHDQRGMLRMGRKQELRREFRFFSICGFAVMLGCTWEYVFMSGSSLYRNGLVLIRFRQQWCLIAAKWRYCRERVDVSYNLLWHVLRRAL